MSRVHVTELSVLTFFQQLLAHAFRSLSKRNSAGGPPGYLADDPARETFALGIVEVLERDAGIRRERSRGFGGSGDSWRPSSRNDSRFPPLGSRPDAGGFPGSRPDSRTSERFPPLGSRPDAGGFQGNRPDSRASERFPPLRSTRPSESERFGGSGSRPDSRTGDRWVSGSRPESRNGDRYGGPASRPSSRNRWDGGRPSSRDRWDGGRPDSRNANTNSRFAATDVRSSLPPGNGFGNNSGAGFR